MQGVNDSFCAQFQYMLQISVDIGVFSDHNVIRIIFLLITYSSGPHASRWAQPDFMRCWWVQTCLKSFHHILCGVGLDAGLCAGVCTSQVLPPSVSAQMSGGGVRKAPELAGHVPEARPISPAPAVRLHTLPAGVHQATAPAHPRVRTHWRQTV